MTLTPRVLPLVAALAAAAPACSGEISGDFAPEEEEQQDGFAVPRDRIELLPFHVREQRLQDVAKLAGDDPAFDVLRAHAYELGDHDYSTGQRPKLQWTSSTMATWVKALEPVCASEALRAAYPSFPDDLPALMTAAYGREVAADEAAEVWSATEGHEAERRYQLTCLGVLSALEFVAR